MDKLVLVTNPGSASRKYALYRGETCLAVLHFEYVDNKPYCEIAIDGVKKPVELLIDDLSKSAGECERLLRDNGALKADEKIEIIGARLVAPSKKFTKDQLVDDNVIADLEKIQSKAPLHTGVNLAEIKFFEELYPDLPIVAISDSSFHGTKPVEAFRYAFDSELQDKLDIGRFGYHGISASSIVEIMKRENILPEKLIICHLGGGASLTAVKNGQSIDNTMGYSPNSGLMMATRTGDIDPSVVFMLQHELGLDDLEMERYLNKKAGFLGVSGFSDDMRMVLEADSRGEERSVVANKLYRYMLRKNIGAMAAALNGVDAIVFTATVGERGADVRGPICKELTYLGFEIDDDKNNSLDKTLQVANLAMEGSKPIYMIKTDELREMSRRAIITAESVMQA